MDEHDLEFQRLACSLLGLVHPEDEATYTDILLNLGHFRIIESEAVCSKIIERYLVNLRDFVDEFQTSIEARAARRASSKLSRLQQQFYEEAAQHAVLHPTDFYRLNGRGDTEEKRDRQSQGRAAVKDLARKELARLQRMVSFTSNFRGYCEYLDRANPSLFFRLSQDILALVPEKNHTGHTYIMSTTETGKSELLKAFVLNYVEHPEYASVLVLDPAGDMSLQIAQWPEVVSQERLVYLDPALSDTHVPVINPFDVEGLTHRQKGKLAGQIVAVIGSLVEGKMGGELSTNMEAVLYPTVRLLIDLPNTSLADIPRVMIGDPRLVALGAQSDDQDVAEFFQLYFADVNKESKKAITQKVNSILGKGRVRAILCGRNSIDLKHALNNRMIVVANLAKGALEEEESHLIGMLLVAMTQSIGMERVHTPEHLRPVTRLVIDECQNFVTSKLKGIIRETRKFKLAVTLAQQEIGGDMPPDLRRVATKTTNVKIAGRSDTTETEQTGRLVGVDPYAIAQCGPGQFFYKTTNKPPFKLRVRSDRLKIKGCMSWDVWEKVKADQLRRYYRRIDEEPASRTSSSTEPPPAPSGPSTDEFE